VQDSDKLDAIGAISIAHIFIYGGAKGRPMHAPDVKPVKHDSFDDHKQNDASVINHFYKKFLLLKDRMNTSKAKQIAEEQHKITTDFLEQFYKKWAEVH
jgi:uncharacterized protein